MVKPPQHVSDINPYIPGKPVEELEREMGIDHSIKLASNENPLGPSPLAIRALTESLHDQEGSNSLNRYPDGSGYYLKQALAEKVGVSEEEIILGNGSNELLDIVVRTFLQPGDEAVMAHPSFVVYQLSVQAQGGRIVQVPLKDYRHNLDAMADEVTSRTKLFFIANPNNPTGTINTREEFNRLMKKLREGILVIADEAYFEYVTDPEYAESIRYFREGRDILILRTFSKIYGLAGLRVGYGIARKDIIAEMNKLRPPFNTSTLAQIAARYALEDDEFVRSAREINEQGKLYLSHELDRLGYTFVPTEANFIYMTLDQDANILYQSLLKKGIIVRPAGPRELRVTIGTPEENRRFIDALRRM
jgi:histidinol-phosphate aminotransferase